MSDNLSNKYYLSVSDNLLFLKSNSKEHIDEQLCSLVFEHICSVLDNGGNQKILLSYQGDQKHYKTIEYIKNFPIKNFQVYVYDSRIGTDISTDEIAVKQNEIDYIVKFIFSEKSKLISISIYDGKTKFYVKRNILETICESFNANHKIEIYENKLDYEAELLSIDKLISIQASKEEILKAFFHVRARYKSRSLVIVNNDYLYSLFVQLFSNYDTSFKVKKSKIASQSNKQIFDLFKNFLPKLKKYQSILKIDNYSNLTADFLIDYRLKNLSKDQIVLLYLDFLVEELKRSNQVDIKKLFVIIPPNASRQVIDLIKQYKMRYYFYDSNNIESSLSDENCLFAYSFSKINANPRYSKIHNNHYFVICLVWMLNIYRNRNNLLSFKYNSLRENLGGTKIIYKSQKFEFNKIKNLVSLIENHYLESKIFNKIEVFNSWFDNNYAVLKLYSDQDKNSLILYFDIEKSRMIFEYHMCNESAKQSVPWKMQYLKTFWWVKKILKLSK
ncbi:hypothetical protein MBOVa_1480 [Mycoplasmopsis bovis 8790]|nr:hypothetical protein MBOVa_1480 [Mycoplasmopsis bovis 8790]